MARPLKMPKMGQTVEESTIVRWCKREGDPVVKGDILLEIETDKATLEVASFTDGTLLRILRSEGDTVPVMETIAVIGDPGESLVETEIDSRSGGQLTCEPTGEANGWIASGAEKIRSKPVGQAPGDPFVAASEEAPSLRKTPDLLRITPRAARLARENAVDPREISGTGPKGRITERDVQTFLEGRSYSDFNAVRGDRDTGSIQKNNLRSGRRDGNRAQNSGIQRAGAEPAKPLPRIRQIIAQRLTESYRSIPHFQVSISVDMTDLMKFRSELKAGDPELTLTDFIVKAVALTLREFPAVNCSTADGQEVTWKQNVNVGLAVATVRGLLVPVIFDADRADLETIHLRARDLIGRARSGKLRPDEMKGSSFTISNLGMMRVESFTAIINPGESAILAVSSALEKPVVKNQQIVIRSMMKMTLSADHRLIDGVLAVRFLNAIKARLEDAAQWVGPR